jgi:hypothetical protein
MQYGAYHARVKKKDLSFRIDFLFFFMAYGLYRFVEYSVFILEYSYIGKVKNGK